MCSRRLIAASLLLVIQGTLGQIQVYLSAKDADSETGEKARLTKQDDLEWLDSSSLDANATRLSITSGTTKQDIIGFGGAITDSSAFVFKDLRKSLQEELLELLYGDSGNKLTMMRVPIGPSDFAASVYSYDESEGDFALNNFSIAHDTEYILPMVTSALEIASAAGRDVRVLASPWTAPSWLKRNKSVRVKMLGDFV